MSKKKSNKSERRFLKFKQRFEEFFEGKLNAAEISSKLGVAKETVYAWKQGSQLPNGISLKKMTEFFDISIDWLLTGHEPKPNAPSHGYTIREIQHIEDLAASNKVVIEYQKKEINKLNQQVKILKVTTEKVKKSLMDGRRQGDAEDLDVLALRKREK